MGVAGFQATISSYATDAAASVALGSGACDVVAGVPVLSRLYESSFKVSTKSPSSHVAATVVVAPKGSVKSQSQWLTPFTFSVWILLIVAACVHALVLWLLESRQNHANFPSTLQGYYEAFMFSCTTMFGFSDKPVRTAAGRVVCISWYLLTVILIATYNASLTNVLAIDFASSAITTEADVKGAGKPVCVISTDEMLAPMKLQFTTAVEATAADCLKGTSAGIYAATVGLETTLQPTASPNCGQLYIVDVEQQYSRSFTWVYKPGLATTDQQCLDSSIASQSGAALGISKYYHWPSSCKPDGSLNAPAQVTLDQMAGQYGIFFCVCALAALMAGTKAVMQVYDIWPFNSGKQMTGQQIWSQSANESITTAQAQQIVDAVLYTRLDLMRADICDDICDQFGGNPHEHGVSLVGFGGGGGAPVRVAAAGDAPTVSINMARSNSMGAMGLPMISEEEDEEDNGEEGGGLEGFASAAEALDYHGPKYFKRYDVNSSGLIDTADELKALVTNLVYKLKLVDTEEDLYQKTRDVDFDEIDGWNYPKFAIWFTENFIDNHVSVSETIGQSIRNASRKAQLENASIKKDIR